MFSATMPHAIAQIAQKFQKDPKMVQVVKKELTVPKVTQYYYEVKPRNKVGSYVPSAGSLFPEALRCVL